MDQNIVELLDAIQAANAAIGNVVERAAPVTRSEIDEAEAFLGVSIPDDILTLYRWSNGTDLVDGPVPALFHGDNLTLVPLKRSAAEMVDHYSARFQMLPGERQDNELGEELSDPEPFPSLLVATAYESLMVVVSLVPGRVGEIWLWMGYGRFCVKVFDSLSEFLELQLGFLDAGVVKEVGPGQYVIDHKNSACDALNVPPAWRKFRWWDR